MAIGTISFVAAQNMSASFDKTINTQCGGSDCDWQGPSILINEMMMSPANNSNGQVDGSLSGNAGAGLPPLIPPTPGRGEWIELYNPDLCQPVDISCYYLGSNVFVSGTENSKETYIIPDGTIIPPGGFCVIRGAYSTPIPPNKLIQNGGNTVEIIMPMDINGEGICISGTQQTPRFWFPNVGGWFGFYDRNGVPQDAVSWGNVSNTNIINDCIPTAPNCTNSVTQLDSYNNFPANRKEFVYTENSGVPPQWGKSLRRVPDGENWDIDNGATPTIGDCNGPCVQPVSASTCDGTAKINVTGGSGDYKYEWSDSEGQLTQTATGLCAGTYTVKVTDNSNGDVQTFSVVIDEHVPTVNFNITPADICNNGQTVPLAGTPAPTAGQTGVYSGTGVSGNNFSAAVSGDGSFPITYTFTDENGCTNSATSTINVHYQPVTSISGVDANYCLSNEIITPTLSPTGGTLTGPGVTNNQISIFDAGIGTHTLKYVVETEQGCADSTEVTFVISGSTPPAFTIQDEICLNADPIPLVGTPAGGEFTSGGQTITTFNPMNFGLGTHYIAYTINDPINPECLAQITDSIIVIDGPEITSNIKDYYCFGEADFDVVMTPAGGNLNGDLLNGNKLGIANATAGNYTVNYNYTSDDGCYSEYTKTFKVGAQLQVEFAMEQDCFQNIVLTPNPANYASYEWFIDGNFLGNISLYAGHVEEHGEHEFSVIATDAHGCKVEHTMVDSVAQGIDPSMFQIPNVVTPNGDGINDYIEMPLMDNECLEYKVIILNRWGNVVFEADKSNPRFNGTNRNGAKLADGVYFYKIVSDDFDCKSDEYKPVCYGFITVISR